LWVAAPWIVTTVYGPAYTTAVPAFRILLLSFPLLSLNYALTHQLIAWNHHHAYAVLCGFALLVNIALNARIIPAMGIDGAAWATLATEIFIMAGCAVTLWGATLRNTPRPATVHAAPVQGR
jgi:O-antigen/teichoic acid export membrane protein